jgi:hypothetical protein
MRICAPIRRLFRRPLPRRLGNGRAYPLWAHREPLVAARIANLYKVLAGIRVLNASI